MSAKISKKILNCVVNVCTQMWFYGLGTLGIVSGLRMIKYGYDETH